MKSFDRVILLPLQPGRTFDRLEIACAVRFFPRPLKTKIPLSVTIISPGTRLSSFTTSSEALRAMSSCEGQHDYTPPQDAKRRLLVNPALRRLNLFTPLFAGEPKIRFRRGGIFGLCARG